MPISLPSYQHSSAWSGLEAKVCHIKALCVLVNTGGAKKPHSGNWVGILTKSLQYVYMYTCISCLGFGVINLLAGRDIHKGYRSQMLAHCILIPMLFFHYHSQGYPAARGLCAGCHPGGRAKQCAVVATPVPRPHFRRRPCAQCLRHLHVLLLAVPIWREAQVHTAKGCVAE